MRVTIKCQDNKIRTFGHVADYKLWVKYFWKGKFNKESAFINAVASYETSS